MPWNAPATYSSNELVTASKLNAQIRDNVQYLYDNLLPKRLTLFHGEAIILAGTNPMSEAMNILQPYAGVMRQTPAALGDSFMHEIVLAPGTYTLYAVGMTNSNCGIVTWSINDNTVGVMDWYAAVQAWEVDKSVANIVIAEGGPMNLVGSVASKNASSTGYLINLTKYWLKQAED